MRGAAPAASSASIDLAVVSARTRPLVVWADDHPDTRDYVTYVLAEHCDVISVSDGAAALRAIQKQLPDLVLSDVVMPQLDGPALLSSLRADPRTRSVPLIFVSARGQDGALVDDLATGADDYLVKPFSSRELIARVHMHIELSRVRRVWASETERHAQELGRVNRELERANHELQAFNYQVSHDLRAPVRAIEHFSHLLLGGDGAGFDAEDRNLLLRIHTGACRMTALIDDLLALSQVGHGELRREPVDLTAIAWRVFAGLRARDPARAVDIAIADGMTVLGDSGFITIALENLLGNAWKFTGKRPQATIAFERESGNRGDVFAIRDNGAGFDMSRGDYLFEPFQRLHPRSDFEGTGIGLAIVRRIVERHGGQVWARGVVGEGATIQFTLAPESPPELQCCS